MRANARHAECAARGRCRREGTSGQFTAGSHSFAVMFDITGDDAGPKYVYIDPTLSPEDEGAGRLTPGAEVFGHSREAAALEVVDWVTMNDPVAFHQGLAMMNDGPRPASQL